MNKIKKYIKPIIYFYTILLVYLIIISIFIYYNLIGYKSVSIISFIIIILLFMMLGFMEALIGDKKGYISGFIIGVFNSLLFSLLSLIFIGLPKLNVIIYFIILIISSTLGGMFGINYKNEQKK